MLKLRFDPQAEERGLKILALGAHCDDIEIGAGGTLLKFLEEYKIESVKWVVFTSNETRKEEAEVSAEAFLSDIENRDISVLTHRDGFLPHKSYEVKDYFEFLKGEFVPDLIFTHYRQDLHQDHRLINELTWNTWRNHLILEYEIPKYDGDLGQPNFYVPLSRNIVDRKVSIIMDAFKSQTGKHWFDEETFRALLRLRAMESAATEKYAEAFHARKIIM